MKILGEPYPMINISGAYKGMGQGVLIPKATLLGFIIPHNKETIFIKLISPSNLVDASLINEFKSVVKTLHF